MLASLPFPELLNARDLGGYPTVDGGVTRTHSLVRAEDLRWPEEADKHPSPVPEALPQVRYERISLLTHTEQEWRLRSREIAKELWKCVVLEHVGHELRRVLGMIADAPPAGLLFHCVAGKDRTGLIAALLLALADARPAAIAEDYAISGENLRAGYLRRYPNTEPERILEILRCPEEGAYNMLKFLDDAGGVRAYLRQIGLTETQISALRSRLR